MKHKAIHSINLQISPTEAWDKLKDLSLAPLYVPGVKSMEFITRKKEGIGTARIVYPQKIKEEVIVWDTGKEVVLGLSKNGRTGFFPFKESQFRYTIMETGGTFMVLSLEYEPALGNIGYLLFGRIIKKRIVKTAKRLKEFYEK